MDVGANLERDVLSNGLDPVGDKLVDDVPWVVGPFSYTVCMCVHLCGCMLRKIIKNYALSSYMGAHFKFPFIEV